MNDANVRIALHHSRAAGTVKLVLLSIALYDDGGGVPYTYGDLAALAGASMAETRRAVQRLTELAEIRHRPHGDDRHLYRFTLQCPPGCDRSPDHIVEAPS